MSSPSDHSHQSDRAEEAEKISDSSSSNPLALPYPWWYELSQRIKLVPWWIRYHLGITKEAELKDRIIEVAMNAGLQEIWARRILRHAISEFSKKGLGVDYYGYHNIDHELEATYFTMLAASGDPKFGYHDLCYLFVAALFHDFDPLKKFDKPNEEAVEWFIRHNASIMRLIQDVGININLVMVLIYRTAYPFMGEIKEKAEERMRELFEAAGIPEQDVEKRRHYQELGWFLSISERAAGYALGSFGRAVELAERNAHALGWHPSVINIESVKYFDIMDGEREMVDRVLRNVPAEYRERFDDNVVKFREALKREMEIRDQVLSKKLSLMLVVEGIRTNGPSSGALGVDPEVKENLLKLHMLLPPPIRVDERDFRDSLLLSDTLLITLRADGRHGAIVGYAKGGPLERYKLRRGTVEENMGRKNTIYLEPMSIEPGYWGARGGHLLRRAFLREAKKRRCRFVSAYAHRSVIERRMERGEPIEIVCKYDPDKLDYYRLDLAEIAEEDLRPLSVEDSLKESMRGERNI